MIFKHVSYITFLNEPEHTVKCFQVSQYNSYNLTSVICLHTVYSICAIDRTQLGATILGQTGPESNCQ